MKKKTKYSKQFLFLIKILSGVIMYFLIRLTYFNLEDHYFDLDSTSIFYLIYTTSLVYLIWQINDYCYSYFQKKLKHNLFNIKNLLKYQTTVLFSSLFFLCLSMYFLHFHISMWLGCEWDESPTSLMVKDLIKSVIIALVFNLVYLIIVFVNYKRNADLSEIKIKKENLNFKYESLRNQIDPHFLFNSFSVLNTLIQTDSNLATEFLSHLSDLYRHVLDNKDHNLISIENEMKCLNDYVFLMKIRHEGCIETSFKLDDPTLKKKVPTMSLQMLIENAIKHNSFSEKYPLKISISNTLEYIVVSNPLNSRATSKISAGIGLENIKNRYQHYSDKKVIIEKDDKQFTVKLPLLDRYK